MENTTQLDIQIKPLYDLTTYKLKPSTKHPYLISYVAISSHLKIKNSTQIKYSKIILVRNVSHVKCMMFTNKISRQD